MTTPAPAIKVKGRGRHYPDPARVSSEEWQHVLECEGMDGRDQCDFCPVDRAYPSVTNIKGTLVQEWMKPWVSRLLAEYAVDNADLIAKMAANDRDKAVKWVKSEPFDQVYNAAERGTSVHTYVERRAKGESQKRAARDLKPSARLHVPAVEAFIRDEIAEFLAIERTVYCERGRYAGTLDAVVRTRKGYKALADWKTSKAVYDDVALQLAALRHADRVLVDASAQKWAAMPPVDGAFAVALKPDADYEMRWAKDTEAAHAAYLSLREVWDWNSLPKSAVLSRPIRPKR